MPTTIGDIDLRQRRAADATVSGLTIKVLCGFAILITIHACGWLGPTLYPAIVIAAVAAGTIGVRTHSAEVIWPWWLIIAAGVLWSVAGVMRVMLHTTGDLTSSRSLVPDLFSLPGYLAFGVGLWGLVQSHRANRDQSAFIDALLVAVGSGAIVFSLIVSPTLSMSDATVEARVAISVYPMIAMFLLVGSMQLAFARSRRSESSTLLVAGSACLTIGDLLYAMGETGSVDLPVNVLDLPYLGVAALLAAAALHPDTHRVRPRTPAPEADPGVGRLVAVTFAFLAPTLAVVTPASGAGRPIQVALCLAVTVIAGWRFAAATRTESALRRQLTRRAEHDALTGLPSRHVIVKLAASLLTDPERSSTSLMFLDLDGFKRINDSRGHAAGDLLLIMVAQRLVDTVRSDDVVGRIGGDEFVIVCADLDANGAMALGDRIRGALREPFDLGSQPLHVRASVGITVASYGDDPENVLREADMAMYQAKESGRDHTTLFDTPMRERINEHVEIEQGLRRGLENNEFSVAFQPIVNTAAERVEGFEALVRWNSPTGIRSPDEFLPVAEDTGLIGAIGAWVLDEACRQIAHWRRTIDPELTVSVNVAASQMQSACFVEDVARCLGRYDLPAEALWLEIVETVMLDNSMHTTAVMMGLRQLGVRLAVDDFGTGYASLTHLRQFPVSRLKIDRSFVEELTTDASTVTLVSGAVFLGTGLGMDVVAEGVETIEQQTQLTRMGCNLIQGYLHSPGVPATEIPSVVASIERHWDGRRTSPLVSEPTGSSVFSVRRTARCHPKLS